MVWNKFMRTLSEFLTKADNEDELCSSDKERDNHSAYIQPRKVTGWQEWESWKQINIEEKFSASIRCVH